MTQTTLPRSDIAGLSAIDVGHGPPVLLLHGVGLRAEACMPQIDAFRSRCRVIAPDMPGHGQSPCPDSPMTMDDFARRYLPVLDDLAEPALVIGHSMGAMIALRLAGLAPDRVRGVAALNAVFQRSPEAAAAVLARADGLDGLTLPDPTPTLLRWFGASASPAQKACEGWLRTADPAGYKLAYTAFASSDVPSSGALRDLACPALFATGALEPNSTPDMSRAMAELAPNGRCVVIEGAAHMMPLTHADTVNAALVAFARGQSS